MEYDLITFGEAMIRLTPPDHMRLEQARSLDVSVGGAEWNVAVNAARLGLTTAWVSCLVDTWSGRVIVEHARRHGVDTSHVVWEEFDGVGRLRNGFYHLEVGVGPRASAVTYDRGHTAISRMTAEMVDWPALLSRCRWLHVSGITPALSEVLAGTVEEVFRLASQGGVRTSYDLNYRGKLWTPERAREANEKIVPFVDVLIGNEEDFEKCLGISAAGGGEGYSRLDPDSYKDVVREAVRRFPNLRMVGTTLRNARTGLLNDWRTLLFDGKEFRLSRVYDNLEIVDRVGGGDSFASALIWGLLNDTPPAEACEFAAAYSALAHTFPGDINWASQGEALKIISGSGARISR
ncbi:MAG: PfkB family carbohydrate kinase [Planctomycetota bacterium]|jgi:2-dehydro-3-deoxygluconokinase